MTHYSEAGGGSASRLPGTLSLSAEYEQLKADYQASVEKLNQTMNSIKTFWSPELKVSTPVFLWVTIQKSFDCSVKDR